VDFGKIAAVGTLVLLPEKSGDGVSMSPFNPYAPDAVCIGG